MQAFLPLLLSAKMLECRVIRTENWTILLNKDEGKFITLLGKSLRIAFSNLKLPLCLFKNSRLYLYLNIILCIFQWEKVD